MYIDSQWILVFRFYSLSRGGKKNNLKNPNPLKNKATTTECPKCFPFSCIFGTVVKVPSISIWPSPYPLLRLGCVCAKEAQPSLRKGPMNHKALVNLSSFTIFSSVVSFLSSSRRQMSDGALKIAPTGAEEQLHLFSLGSSSSDCQIESLTPAVLTWVCCCNHVLGLNAVRQAG